MSLRKTINKFLQGSRYQLKKINPALNEPDKKMLKITIENFLAKAVLENNNFFFVQIGANDGKRADDSYNFITRHHLKGIVVEPLKDMFERLSENYASEPQITKVNKAIHSTAKTMPLYRIKSDIEESVECISLTELFLQTGVEQISFLQVDTEGYDYEIIKMIDFNTMKPEIIRYECSVFSQQDNQACIDLLAQQGYQFFDEGNDIIAVLNRS